MLRRMTPVISGLFRTNGEHAGSGALLPIVFNETTTATLDEIPVRAEIPGGADRDWPIRMEIDIPPLPETCDRIERAKSLLLNPHYAVGEIANYLDFRSLAHFDRTFRRVTGESPEAYRVASIFRRRGDLIELGAPALAGTGRWTSIWPHAGDSPRGRGINEQRRR